VRRQIGSEVTIAAEGEERGFPPAHCVSVASGIVSGSPERGPTTIVRLPRLGAHRRSFKASRSTADACDDVNSLVEREPSGGQILGWVFTALATALTVVAVWWQEVLACERVNGGLSTAAQAAFCKGIEGGLGWLEPAPVVVWPLAVLVALRVGTRALRSGDTDRIQLAAALAAIVLVLCSLALGATSAGLYGLPVAAAFAISILVLGNGRAGLALGTLLVGGGLVFATQGLTGL